MKKIQLLGVALVAICALSAFTSSAFALEFTSAEWLEGGVAITAAKAANTEGELLFENTSVGAAILCSGLFEGTVGAGGADTVTKVFNLSATAIEELDEKGEKGIACTSVKLCEGTPEIWPVNLPFKTTLQLDTTEEKWFDLVEENVNKKFAAYLIKCKVLGVSVEELCEAVSGTFGEVSNATTDVESLGALTPKATCKGTKEVGLIENNTGDVALVALVSGAALTVSG